MSELSEIVRHADGVELLDVWKLHTAGIRHEIVF